ncbi:TolC family protein [Chryseobacterium sp.]|uniref:TolC family protein n=1 Tax=Chryseobacterium sp. TaxID=1871047 RepID=UPI0011C9EAD3|nr:TolC family protein [Chryseobacterium sp.]TXF76063.1 TolC family protein [Chryseobacterium sp.]
MKKFWILFFGISFLGLNAQKKWSLQECVDYAVEHNLQIIQNNYNKQIQDLNLKIAKNQYLPGVSASLSNNGSFGQQRYINVTQRNDNFTNSANVGADILLFNNGRLEKTVRKTEFEVEAAQYDTETITNNISLQIAQQYLTILLNKEITKISESALQNAERQYNRAKITTDVGTTAKTILAEAEAALARERQNLKTAEINTRRSLFDLAQLLQLTDYQNFDVEDVPVMGNPEAPLYSAENIISTAYGNQPQIKAAEARIRAAEAQTQITRTAFWPTITANAGLGTSYFNTLVRGNVGVDPETGQSITESGFFKQYTDNFGQQIGVSANIPIFNKGITRLQVEQSKLNEELAKNSFAQQKQQVLQNVQKAQFDAESNYEAFIAALETEKSSELALDFAQKSYDAGRSTIYDLNVARNNYANAQGSVAQAKYNYLFSMKLLNFYAGIPLSL